MMIMMVRRPRVNVSAGMAGSPSQGMRRIRERERDADAVTHC